MWINRLLYNLYDVRKKDDLFIMESLGSFYIELMYKLVFEG